MDSRSSVDAAPIGAFVAWLLAAAASAQFALFLMGVLGDGVWPAWCIGLLVLGWGARLASIRGEERALVTAQATILVAPLLVMTVGFLTGAIAVVTFAGALLGVLAVGWGIAIPVTQWIAGLLPPKPNGRPPSPPLPGASFAIALFFALPASRVASAVAGLVAVAALVLCASLGSLAARSREGGSLGASPQLWSRWGAAAAVFAIVAGLVGFGAAAAANPPSFLGHPMDVPPLPGDGGTGLEPTTGGGGSMDPLPHGAGGHPNLHPNPTFQPNPNPSKPSSGTGSSSPPPPSKGSPQRDWREYLKLALFAVLALGALAAARRYGDRILAFLERLAERWGGPIHRFFAGLRARRDERVLLARLAGMPDPFAPSSDPSSTVARVEATLAALGVVRRPNEAIPFHLRRAGSLLGGEAERWGAAARAANQVRFAASHGPEADLQTLAALDTDLLARLDAFPDAEARRREVRLSYVRATPEPESA
ncbi:hypothetical protein BH11ARM2_BH11ARM2_07540 [soil metagenome]